MVSPPPTHTRLPHLPQVNKATSKPKDRLEFKNNLLVVTSVDIQVPPYHARYHPTMLGTTLPC